jgi:tetratricopeptide (TPR) repeat protein
MQLSDHIETIIIRYLHNKATPAEREEVENRLKSDPPFKNTFDRLKQEQIVLESLVAFDTRAQVNHWINQQNYAGRQSTLKKRWLGLLCLLAGIALLYWFLQRTQQTNPEPIAPLPFDSTENSSDHPLIHDTIKSLPQNRAPLPQEPIAQYPIPEKPSLDTLIPWSDQALQDLAVAYYELPPDEGSLRGDDESNQVTSIWNLIRSNQFTNAVKLIDSLQTDFNTEDKNYLLGHIALGQKKYDLALNLFQKTLTQLKYKDEAQWYKLLASLALGHKKYAQSKFELDVILKDPTHPHYSDAVKLAAELRMK